MNMVLLAISATIRTLLQLHFVIWKLRPIHLILPLCFSFALFAAEFNFIRQPEQIPSGVTVFGIERGGFEPLLQLQGQLFVV